MPSSPPAPITPPPPAPRPATQPVSERSLTQFLTVLGRALRLRCPHCGQAPVLISWGKIHERCAHCHFRFERSSDSYFTGAMFFNLITAEFLFAVGMGSAIVAMWPDINWDYITYGAVGGMAITPIVLYPFSKVLYLTVDTFMRPVRPEECDPTNTRWTRTGV